METDVTHEQADVEAVRFSDTQVLCTWPADFKVPHDPLVYFRNKNSQGLVAAKFGRVNCWLV